MKVPTSLKVIMAATLTMCVVAITIFYREGNYPQAIIISVVFVAYVIACSLVIFGDKITGVSPGELWLWMRLNSEKIFAIFVLTGIALVGLFIIFNLLKSYDLWQ